MNDELVGKDQVYEYYSQKINFLEELISNITNIESYLDIEINLCIVNLQISINDMQFYLLGRYNKFNNRE